MRAIAHERVSAPRLALLWFGIQAVWGAVLGISLQARCVELAGHASVAAYGRISVAGALAAMAVQLLVGPLSDARRRAGDRRIGFYSFGVLGAVASLIGFYGAPNLTLLLVAVVALQATMNLAIGPYQAIVPDFVPVARMGNASAWMAGLQSAGNAIGGVLASRIGGGMPLALWLAGALLASGAATVLPLRAYPLQPIALQTPFTVSRTLVNLFISRALVYLGFYTLLGYFFFYVNDVLVTHLPVSATMASGLGIVAFTLAGVLGAAIAGAPADRLDERLVVTIGGGLLAAAIVALALAHTPVAIAVAVSVAGVGWGIFLCADWAFACRLLPHGALATTMALWNIAVIAPQMFAPLFATVALSGAGVLASASGPRVAFILAAIEVTAGVAWIWRLSRSRPGK